MFKKHNDKHNEWRRPTTEHCMDVLIWNKADCSFRGSLYDQLGKTPTKVEDSSDQALWIIGMLCPISIFR